MGIEGKEQYKVWYREEHPGWANETESLWLCEEGMRNFVKRLKSRGITNYRVFKTEEITALVELEMI